MEGAGRGAPRTLLGRGGRVAEAAVCLARGRLAGRRGAAGRGPAPRPRPRTGEGPRPGHGVQRAVEGGGAAHHAGLRRHARCGRTEARLDNFNLFGYFLVLSNSFPCCAKDNYTKVSNNLNVNYI